MLTHDDLAILRKPFRADEHEFFNKNAYLTESAIATRIEEVDPSWTLEILSASNRDTIHVAKVRLTIKGVFRDGVGQSSVMLDKDTKTREVNEPEKAAATDAFKRAARLFGIGRYILDFPDDIKDMGALKRYLGESNPYSAKPAAPANDDAWTQASAGKFAALCKGKGIDPLKALNVSKWDEWKGTYSEAVAKIAA